MKRESLVYGFLKRCEQPPRETLFWKMMNLLMNVMLASVGKVLLADSHTDGRGGEQYVLHSSKNMGDILALYRSLDELKKENHFSDVVVVADKMFKRPLDALHVDKAKIVPFWKIIAMGKAIQLFPEKYPGIAAGAPWLFFGVNNSVVNSGSRTLPCKIQEESLRRLFPLEDMKGKTVILSPYEQTVTIYRLEKLPWKFWTLLAEALKQKGFYVFTNCNGKTEIPIDGTEIFFPPLNEVAGAVEYAGYCVSMRSGFTDWISSAALTKEVVLYPTTKFYAYYNMEMLWGKSDLLEYVYGKDGKSAEELAEMVKSYLLGEEISE